jgi:glycosyltransferase involved in cell wall biosynthesis
LQDCASLSAVATIFCMNVDISVVVPLYNKRLYIRRTLESILRQTVTNFEIVVVDDGSTDGSHLEVLALSDERIRLVIQENQGESAARNRGIRDSTAPLIAFLDADDEWDSGFLKAVVELAHRFPEAGLMGTGFRRRFARETDRETSLRAPRDETQLLITDYLDKVREGDFITSSSVAVRREVFDEGGGFMPLQPIGADSEMWARISLRWPFAFDTRILATYHSEAEGRSFDLWRMAPPYPPVVRTLRQMLASGQVNHSVKPILERYVDWRLMKYALWLLDLGERERLSDLLATERFRTARFRVESIMIASALPILPMRFIRALKFKPINLINAIGGKGRAGVWHGRNVISRTLPAPMGVNSELGIHAVSSKTC